MASMLPWFSIVCVVLGGKLGRASLHAEFGVSIHPVFSTSLYIPKNPHASEDPREKEEQELLQSQAAKCEILNTAESGPELHEVKTLRRKSFSLFVRPESSFKKLVFRIRLQNILYVSGDSYSDEDITLDTKDLTHSEDSQWTHVRVEHYQHRRRGLDRHAFRISFANITLSSITHDSWLWHGFKGFTVFAKGGAKILLNCAPGDLDKTPVADYVLSSMWVMAGLVILAALLLAALCLVWVYLKCQSKKTHSPVLPKKYPVYDEFDEEVLERVRQKVEALRKGKSLADPDTVIVSYPPRQNFYTLEGIEYGGVEGVSPEEHHYEDIEKNYKHVYATDNVYQTFANVDENRHYTSTVDNIYESLPCFENYLEKRGDEARASPRHMTG